MMVCHVYVILHDDELWRQKMKRNEVAGKYFVRGKPVIQGETDRDVFLVCKVADEDGSCNCDCGWGRWEIAGEAERFEADVGVGLSVVARYGGRIGWVDVVEGVMGAGRRGEVGEGKSAGTEGFVLCFRPVV